MTCNDCAKPPCLLIPSVLQAASSSCPLECDSPGCTGEERQLGHRRAERAGKGGICVGPHAGGHRLTPSLPSETASASVWQPSFHCFKNSLDVRIALGSLGYIDAVLKLRKRYRLYPSWLVGWPLFRWCTLVCCCGLIFAATARTRAFLTGGMRVVRLVETPAES